MPLSMTGLYPECGPDREHKFEVRDSTWGPFGKTVTFCIHCGLTPQQLLQVRANWGKAGIS